MTSWDPNFVSAIRKYSRILYEWTRDNLTHDFLEAAMGPEPEYQVSDWPLDTDDYELGLLQHRFVADTFERLGQFNESYLNEDHADETFAIYLARAAARLWAEKLRLSRLYSSTHFDDLVRSVIATPPGPGIGYLCLSLASTTPINDTILNEIDISRKFSPELPFTREESAELMKMMKKETRLRLALVLATAFGRCCNKFKIRLEEQTFEQDFQRLIQHFILPPSSELSDLVRDDIGIIIDVLILSRRENSEMSVPPPSPQKPAPQPTDDSFDDVAIND